MTKEQIFIVTYSHIMKIKILTLLIFAGAFLSSTDHENNHPEKKKVFICNSDGAKKYHLKKDCKGLENCKNEVLSVTKAEAINQGKTELCGFED